MKYSIDNKPVNKATYVISIMVRAIFFVLSLVVVAAATPLGLGQTFALGGAVVLLNFARTAVIEVQ